MLFGVSDADGLERSGVGEPAYNVYVSRVLENFEEMDQPFCIQKRLWGCVSHTLSKRRVYENIPQKNSSMQIVVSVYCKTYLLSVVDVRGLITS